MYDRGIKSLLSISMCVEYTVLLLFYSLLKYMQEWKRNSQICVS